MEVEDEYSEDEEKFLDEEPKLEIVESESEFFDPMGHGSLPVVTKVCTLVYKEASTQTTGSSRIAPMSAESLLADGRALYFYTGLENQDQFDYAFNSLGAHNWHKSECFFRSQLTLQDQFTLVLAKFRTFRSNYELSFLFNVSEAIVQKVLTSWINSMYREWSKQNLWLSRDSITELMPEYLKENFPKARVILEGLEIPIQKPPHLKLQEESYSSDKNRYAMKIVLGITPHGLISFVSNAYGAAISYSEIVINSELRSLCDEGDVVFADGRFDIVDHFKSEGIIVKPPLAIKAGNHGIVRWDKQISAKVLMETYGILRHPLRQFEMDKIHKIVYLCCILGNFRNFYVKKETVD